MLPAPITVIKGRLGCQATMIAAIGEVSVGTDGCDSPLSVQETETAGCVVVRNDYQWVGNPQAGRFAVYLDGKAAGWAPLGGEFRQRVLPGTHFLRVRWNYFLSPRVLVSVKPGETKRYSADKPRNNAFVVWAKAMVDPFHALALTETGPQDGQSGLAAGRKPVSRRGRERAARIGLAGGLAPLIPLAALVIWLLGFTVHPHRVAYACVVAGIFLVIVGTGQWVIYRARMKWASKLLTAEYVLNAGVGRARINVRQARQGPACRPEEWGW